MNWPDMELPDVDQRPLSIRVARTEATANHAREPGKRITTTENSAAGIRPGGRTGVSGERGLVRESVIGVGIRLLKVVALYVIEPEFPEYPEIVCFLDEFRDGLLVHGFGEINDGLERGAGEYVGRQVTDKRARYLEEIDRHVAQTIERAQIV